MFGKGHLIAGEKNGMFGRTGENHPSFGRKHTPESIAKMSGENHWTFGKGHLTAGENHWMFGRTGENHNRTRSEYAQARVFFFLEIAPMKASLKEKRQQLYQAFEQIPQRTLYTWFRKWQLELEIK